MIKTIHLTTGAKLPWMSKLEEKKLITIIERIFPRKGKNRRLDDEEGGVIFTLDDFTFGSLGKFSTIVPRRSLLIEKEILGDENHPNSIPGVSKPFGISDIYLY